MTSTAITARSTATSARAASTSRIDFDLRTAQGIAKYRAFLEEAADLCVCYGGSLSGEHGDGQQRAELLTKQYGEELLEAMREFKRIWDPDWKMNPGKVIDPYRLDEHLKLGTDYNPWRPAVRFSYQQDDGDFAHAALRCVGIGKCRVPDAGTVMCPSYMVTREEKDSTRGRARLLFEMLEGDVITDGWQSKEVYDALDLCLACKGCTSDCPVQVDMPTYKSEFLHHHFKSLRRWRPRYAYAFGLIDQAARVASRMPELVNFLTQTPGLARVAKLAAGMAPERAIPEFAPLTLQQWWQQRGGTQNPSGRRVVLWPDTFNNHFHTDVGVACVEAIEDAGWQVVMPQGHVCCGRPLYDYGFLDLAQRYLQEHVVGPPRRDPPGNPGRRNGAELPRRVQGRTDRHDAARRRRPAPGQERHALRRVLRTLRDRGPATRPQGARVGPLPPQGHRRHGPRAQAAGAHGNGDRTGQRRLLRPGRLLGIRTRSLRRIDEVAASWPCCRPCATPTRRRSSSPTASPARPRSSNPTSDDERCTWRR